MVVNQISHFFRQSKLKSPSAESDQADTRFQALLAACKTGASEVLLWPSLEPSPSP